MLAEAADRDLHKRAFDMTYSWLLWDNLHAITTKGGSVDALTGGYIAEHVSIWGPDAYRLNFTDNHDKNAWEGTQFSNFGKGLNAAIVLTGTIDGMPLTYSGQEAGLDRSLAFFEKDEIEWKEHSFYQLFQKLFTIKHQHKALWNGAAGGNMIRILNDKPEQVVSFFREKDGNKVIAVFNWSNQPLTVKLDSKYHAGTYKKALADEHVELKGEDAFSLDAWGYMVLIQ